MPPPQTLSGYNRMGRTKLPNHGNTYNHVNDMGQCSSKHAFKYSVVFSPSIREQPSNVPSV
ncbi:hypothetical protein M378DRAFT_163747 [Amanita muscaria Koide BX008]|uniref:Uncharacterized protein n=1 Tax=Amanita muscaria (strain Koide BX008) TaxID=946122 RepID=A0A0C2TBG0_AMAMK|nr:hypothetical protein M378DRAFT_163747 [Amanita muscaria Koide BX008]